MLELGLFQWIIGGMTTMGLALFAYLNGRIGNLKDSTVSLEKDHLKFRTYVAETFTTKEDVKNVENKMSHTLDRLHGRIDDIDRNVKELPQQIINYFKDK